MTIAIISSAIFGNGEYQASKIGDHKNYRIIDPYFDNYTSVVSEIDCDLIYSGAISNLGEVADDDDYAVAHINSIGQHHGLSGLVGIEGYGAEFGHIG